MRQLIIFYLDHRNRRESARARAFIQEGGRERELGVEFY